MSARESHRSKMMPKFQGRNNENWLMFAQRLKVVLKAEKVLKVVLGEETKPTSNTIAATADLDKEIEKFEDRVDKAIDLIVQCLGDNAMKVCMPVVHDPKLMWEKLEEAYSDTSGNTKRFLWDNIHAKKFTGKKETMTDHIAELELYFSQLESMGVPKDDSLQISILLESVAINPEYSQLVEMLRVSCVDLNIRNNIRRSRFWDTFDGLEQFERQVDKRARLSYAGW
eukprot:Plantae.Rhodophyta-Palmaria_palmata.ctg1467.p1 GENE.Plantae.Rhodophyta-Palmaria_palmata.ctg1467~~Plantae.Rhodophyta-Palmaria_palmata.ctg1467.p1  ORF type:complete len:227 (+),score=20.79 Plantae.Rhodophyta-Palmaria_palmata.ctg1467:92-772(+)